MAIHCHNGPGLPVASLHEIHDCLTLALDAGESARGYSQAEREARSYVRAALRRVGKLMEGVV
ncbi:hypothetical protein [Paracoccus aestuariivivens]|uniref:Pyruvate carboxyltransferase domain-containing protein n=1 Tax=Paracoccus aestuariivivens TaxID=1820333 RepID=A0A6L6J6I7_9RHOB|nr:hypothetical protein [Paracoccus aestuariivivens]MTH77570.1 hypothetical protein [Paracoccus aestuariivivens]